ncbi:hypothetical protein NC651_037703 [Populus alba x Populus x berolinensis]|nr:hypothetical protein NC651_037703 [Populus alba x Populus x berolinensis]
MSDACWTKRTYLTLTNDLGPGLQLSLHCKSGSVDLGQQHLAPQGSWSFDFCSSFWGVTSYFCNVVWNGGNKWFDVYTGKRDSFICGECGWSIRPTGPCRDHGGKLANSIQQLYISITSSIMLEAEVCLMSSPLLIVFHYKVKRGIEILAPSIFFFSITNFF